MFANTQMPCMSFSFPDICLTPIPTPVGPIPVPIPYPNIALSAAGIPTVLNQFIVGMPVHNLATVTAMSMGDTPGLMGGVVSHMIMGPARHLMGSFKVFKGGMPTTKMLSPTGQNGMLPNMPGITLTPSQVKVLILA